MDRRDELSARRAIKSADYLVEELDGQTVLYSPSACKTVHLNQSSRLIWELCDGNRTVAEISAALEAAFPESIDQVRSDVERMMGEFQSEGIVDWV